MPRIRQFVRGLGRIDELTIRLVHNFVCKIQSLSFMLYGNLKHLTDSLSDYLGNSFNSLEKLAEVNSIKVNPNAGIPNKIIISLINIEREAGMTNFNPQGAFSSGVLKQKNSPWFFNMYFVMAAVFDDKLYEESLRILSTAIEFLQSNQKFQPDKALPFMIEPVTLSIHEQNNIWAMMGGHHYPAFFGKIKLLAYDGQQISRVVSRVSKTK